MKLSGLKDKIRQSTNTTSSALDPTPFLEKSKVVDFFKADWPLFIAPLGGALRDS
jgi:Tfp pilus assembly PilM family ATPase